MLHRYFIVIYSCIFATCEGGWMPLGLRGATPPWGPAPPPPWSGASPSVVFRRPMDAMVDLTNDLGVAILQDNAHARSNFAFSPYGLASVLVVLYEGAMGESARQLHIAAKFPWDRDITRIGFRDIHRHLRSYFSHEGYLSGITLNKDSSSLRPDFKRVLRFYGYDVDVEPPKIPKPTTAKPTTVTQRPLEEVPIVTPPPKPETTSKQTDSTTTGEGTSVEPKTTAAPIESNSGITEQSVILNMSEEPTTISSTTKTTASTTAATTTSSTTSAPTTTPVPTTTTTEQVKTTVESTTASQHSTSEVQTTEKNEQPSSTTESSTEASVGTTTIGVLDNGMVIPDSPLVPVSHQTPESTTSQPPSETATIITAPPASSTSSPEILETSSTPSSTDEPLESRMDDDAFMMDDAEITNSMPVTTTSISTSGPIEETTPAVKTELVDQGVFIEEPTTTQIMPDASTEANRQDVSTELPVSEEMTMPTTVRDEVTTTFIVPLEERVKDDESSEIADVTVQTLTTDQPTSNTKSGITEAILEERVNDDESSVMGDVTVPTAASTSDTESGITDATTIPLARSETESSPSSPTEINSDSDDSTTAPAVIEVTTSESTRTSEELLTRSPTLEEREPVTENESKTRSVSGNESTTQSVAESYPTTDSLPATDPSAPIALDTNPQSGELGTTTEPDASPAVTSIPEVDSTTIESSAEETTESESTVVERIFDIASENRNADDEDLRTVKRSPFTEYVPQSDVRTLDEYFLVSDMARRGMLPPERDVYIYDENRPFRANTLDEFLFQKKSHLLPSIFDDSEDIYHPKTLDEFLLFRNNGKVNPPIQFRTEIEFENSPKNRFPRTIADMLHIPTVPDLSLQLQNGMFDSHVSRKAELYRPLPRQPFLMDSSIESPVPVMTYTNVFPYAYIPRLHSTALEFPLDDDRYKLLIILPMERRGLRQLTYDLSAVTLRGVLDALRPARVRATVPTFMVEGFVILTPALQRMGIWNVFDPRKANLTAMSADPELYVRNIEQSVTVVIRNYVEILDIQTRTMAARGVEHEFIATHPFLYFVMDTETNVSLMAGQMLDPLNSRIY